MTKVNARKEIEKVWTFEEFVSTVNEIIAKTQSGYIISAKVEDGGKFVVITSELQKIIGNSYSYKVSMPRRNHDMLQVNAQEFLLSMNVA